MSASASETLLVTGAGTLIGDAIVAAARRRGGTVLTDAGVDLCEQDAVRALLREGRPERVIHAAGKSAGIAGNQKRPGELLYDNLAGTVHLLQAAHEVGVCKLLYLASSCSYPRLCEQPMRPDSLLHGPLEPTNESYAMAKLAGVQMCKAYRAQYGAPFVVGIPANVFGPGDDFSPDDSHVIAALLMRFHQAKASGTTVVEIWGTGTPKREFIYAPDLADACLFALETYDADAPLNLGGGSVVSIAELAAEVKRVVGYDGGITFDTSRPDGMPVKILDTAPLRALGWNAPTAFCDALQATYDDYCAHLENPTSQDDKP